MKFTKYFDLKMSVALPLLTLLISLLITYQVFHVAKVEVEHKAQVYFDFRVREATNLINQRMKAYELALRGAAGLFKASDSVERNDFKQYVASINLAKNYPGIQGLGFSLIVPSAKKVQHIASIRSKGFPEYAIKPDGQRDIYTSIIYLEPFSDRNLRAFGYDMFSHPVRHAAMQKAIDSGEATLSGEVKLLQETGKQEQAGFLMYFPIYRNGTRNEMVSERREHILGWVYLPFRMNDLMNGLFGEHAADLHIRIFDGKSMSNVALMYDSKGSNLTSKMPLSKTLQVQIADHPWTIVIEPLIPLSSRIGINYPKLVAVVGPIVSTMLSLLIWFLMSSREITRKLNIQNDEKDKRADELLLANTELAFQKNNILLLQQQLQATLSAIPDPIFELDLDGRYHECYAMKNELLAAPRELMLGKLVSEVLPVEASDIVMSALVEANVNGISRGKLFTLTLQNSDCWFELTVVKIYRTPTDGPRFIVLSRDVSESHNQAEKLQMSDLNFRFILENSPIAIRMASKTTGLLVFVNKKYCELAELPAQDLIGTAREQFDVAELDYDKITKKSLKKVAGQSKLVKLTLPHKIKWALASSIEMIFEGEPIYLGWFYEVTEQKTTEAALLESQERLNFSFEGSGDGMWDWDVISGRVIYSKQWKGMLGYEEGELKDEFKEWETRVHPDDLTKAMSDIQSYLGGASPRYVNDHRLRCKDGSYKWILTRGVITSRDADGNPLRLIGTHTDITTLKNIEQALLAAKSEAEKANQDKSKFLAAASHDLRQPLTALSLYVDVLTKQNNGNDSGLGKKIQGCVSSLSELLDNLLNVSKLDAGAVVATKTTFRLADVLTSLVNIHAAEATLKGLSLHLRPTNLVAHTDETILQRILGNLIANAIRYTHKGGVLIGCRRHNGKQWIEVWDSGVGFPSSMAKHIFEEFTQLGDNSRSVGSGLGLAIVSKSAQLLGLELRVHSRLGRGSMFAIEIPQGEVSLIETSSESKTVADKWLIALVDDNQMVLDATSFALKAVGHQVVVGKSELDLLKNIGYQEPDILISDYRLADNKTGLDLILKARVMFGEDLPAILITGDTDPKLIKLFSKHKIEVCYKPLKIDVLNNLISEVMLKN
ncbi:MAG: CHASE domain-containing protein [Methylophilales bacterium]|nr:CHASE domain-containing protein [Methylophilales bacterium]